MGAESARRDSVLAVNTRALFHEIEGGLMAAFSKRWSSTGRQLIGGLVLLLLAAPLWVEAQQGAPVIKRKSTSIDTRLQEIERLIEGQGLVDMLSQVEALQAEVRRLRGEVENQSYELEQLRKRQRSQSVDADARLQTLERGGVPNAPATAGSGELPVLGSSGTNALPQGSRPLSIQTEGGGPAVVDRSRPAVDGSVGHGRLTSGDANGEADYKQAFALLKAGQYDESIAAFNAYLVEYPQSAYADNAQYWLGEAYYVLRQFEPALNEYRKLVESYPNSQKITHALLKMGYSYDELGQTDAAVAQLARVTSHYAGTTAARLADERLQRIRAER